MSALSDLRGVPLADLDMDLVAEALRRILANGPAVPVAAFNSAI